MQQRSLSGVQRHRLWVAMSLLVLTIILSLTFFVFQVAPRVHATTNVTSSLPDHWWKTLTGERTIDPVNYGYTIQDVQNQLDTYQAEGYQIINFDWPISGGPDSIFGGFSAVDYNHVDPRLAAPGTNADTDWTNFTAAVHSRGMAVDAWFNPSYVWTGAPMFKQAEADVLTYGTVRANQPANSPARYFAWRNQAGVATKPCDTCGDSGGPLNDWITDPDAGSNVSYYSIWANQPSGDFASTEWRSVIVNALNHWMDTGLDGFVFDYPIGYYHCDATCKTDVFISTVHARTNKAAFSENDGAGPNWYDGTHAAEFWDVTSFDSSWTAAIKNNDPSSLTSGEAFTSIANNANNGSVSQLPINPSILNNNIAENLLAAATIASTGAQFGVAATGVQGGYFDFGDLGAWPDATNAPKLKAITDAVRATPALGLATARTAVPTNDAHKYLSYLRSTSVNQQEVLVVLNFQSSQQTITVDASNKNIIADQTSGDLLNGGNGPTLSGTNFTVTLPAYGYGYYTLNSTSAISTATPTTTPPTPTPTLVPGSTMIDDNASGWTYSGWGPYSDGNAYQGTAHGGSGNGAYGQYTFTGTRVDVYTWKGSGGGTVQVCVDSTCSSTLSLANSTDIYNQDIYSAAGLTSGSHTVKISGNSTDASLWEMVDYIVVSNSGGGSTPTATATTILPTPTSVPPTPTPTSIPPTATPGGGGATTTVDDSASGWTYSGWSAYSDGAAYQGTAHGGSGNGSFAQYTFSGTGIDVYTWKGPDGGTVQICVDTTCSSTLSLQNGTDSYNQKLYSVSGLSNGSHTVKITANSTNSSKWEMVDYLIYTH